MIKNPKNYVGHSIEAEGLVDDSKYINGKGVYSVILLKKGEYTISLVIVETDKKEALAEQSYIRFEGEITGIYKENLDLSVQGGERFGRKKSLSKKVKRVRIWSMLK